MEKIKNKIKITAMIRTETSDKLNRISEAYGIFKKSIIELALIKFMKDIPELSEFEKYNMKTQIYADKKIKEEIPFFQSEHI